MMISIEPTCALDFGIHFVILFVFVAVVVGCRCIGDVILLGIVVVVVMS